VLRSGKLARAAKPYPPRCDWDNLGKGISDALTGIAWHDDEQVVDGRCRKRYGEPGEAARTVVTIRRRE
jgi:Holliday junction resolvase RusA-like endonuclease